jgi:mono/diheme cytochrome c family protein
MQLFFPLTPMLFRSRLPLALLLPAALCAQPAMEKFKKDIQPMLETYCYSCHGDGESEGGVTLDAFRDEDSLKDHKLWLRVLKNTRSRIMPPVEEDYLTNEELEKFAAFIKRDIFELNPAMPDPGRVTVRRLNRVDYRNTVRELMGVDYDTQKEFPADDTGHGFDNNGDVLTISPMLMEKYLDAAQAVVSGAVPTQPRVVAENRVEGRQFITLRMESPVTLLADATTSTPPPAAPATPFQRPAPAIEGRNLDLS